MNSTKNKRIRLNEFRNQYEESFIEKIGDKKLVCFGASSRWKDINRIICVEDLVEYFVDEDSSRWGEIYFEKEIRDPSVLKSLDTDKYVVVVLAGAYDHISTLLDEYGLKREVDYFNLFQYLYLTDFTAGSFNTLIRFLDSVPEKMRYIAADKTDQRIGIVMNVESLNTGVIDAPFSVALFLILKWKGYDVRLIVDYLSWDGDIIQYEGRCQMCRIITDQIVDKLRKVVPESDIMYIDYSGNYEISEQDAEKCEKIAEYAADWSTWHRNYNGKYIPVALLQKKLSEIYKKNLPYIDAFFEQNHFDVINPSTALHKRGGIFNYIAERRNIRVSSQDGYDKESMLISPSGPACCGTDIPRVFVEGWIKEAEEEEIIKRAVRMWEKRKGLTISTKEEDFNLTRYRELVRTKGRACMGLQTPRAAMERSYDVVIPLNIKCDGEALVAETVFGSLKEWLTQTLDFVINKLGKSVLLREHPALRYHKGYRSTEIYDAYPEILEPYKDNDMLLYVRSDEDLNLYQYMERCKVVLPWTSTSGMEAGIMKKDVVVHTNVFYKNAGFVQCAHSVNEYFDFVKKSLLDEKEFENDNREAFKYFYFSMARRLVTKFTIFHSNVYPWQFENFEELLKEEGVEEVIQIVAENVPSCYLIEKQHRRIYDL